MSERRSAARIAALVVAAMVAVGAVIAFVIVTGGSEDDDSRLEELANDPLLVDTPVTAEVIERATVDPARNEAFGVREEFHNAGARWLVPLGLDATAAAWASHAP